MNAFIIQLSFLEYKCRTIFVLISFPDSAKDEKARQVRILEKEKKNFRK